MRSMCRVADENNILVVPLLAKNPVELQPHRRATQVLGIRNQPVAIQSFCKEPFTKSNGPFRFHLVYACSQPVLLRRFDDERGPILIEAIGMQIKPAPLGLSKVESEGLELFARPQPNEAILPHINIRLKNGFIFSARDRRHTVRRDHKITLRGVLIRIGNFSFKHELDTKFGSTLLQDIQQPDARDPAKTVAAGCQLAPFEENVNVVPVTKCLRNGSMCLWIGVLEAVHCLVGKYNAPAERRIGAVPLNDCNIPRWISFLRENGKIQSRRPSA